MLSKAITAKLNEQINLEFYSSNVYLQMSAWCDNHGYEGAAAFLLRHADEELEHMQKLFTYVSETSGMPLLGKIEAPKHDYASLKEVFETTLEHEKLVTSKINELVECTFAEKDYSTYNGMLQNNTKKKNYLTVLLINLNFLVKAAQRFTTLIVS